jgi:hypothetical protein
MLIHFLPGEILSIGWHQIEPPFRFKINKKGQDPGETFSKPLQTEA